MLIRKLFKRPEPVPTPAAKAVVAQSKPANTHEQGYKERRSFPRPLPVPEVLEQDWKTWVDVTRDQKSA
ncbi:hypothetical protein [Rhodoferax antarcticus]|uniref:Uncharacterized protein n=1 Tax=Rhodoferax antarcticus ANT.BR TaxID=1111071 RepID=A0A1Q8YBE0_9BURK|nr:hypothetical protein [Rhodoferax antarcticus]APW46855.1 hypothetical protein RA876_11340 [Rhodoferax antarcticus]MCW2311348.1 hypothetical protein [Rhodoferax antarcticus]OLP05368.1 hypothetical protein BLL52_3494 [Rhodoferax antarcticus ANT.BR]